MFVYEKLKVAVVLLITLFAMLCVLIPSSSANEIDGYKRSYFEHWIDADHDGQDTRQEVLIRDSLVPVEFNAKGKVVRGLWFCPYTLKWISDPNEIQIDHVVALKEAWLSGADKWDKKKRRDYANYLDDPQHLMAVYGPANQEKKHFDPAQWMPFEDNWIFNQMYMQRHYNIKEHWELCYDLEEIFVMENAGFKIDRPCLPDKKPVVENKPTVFKCDVVSPDNLSCVEMDCYAETVKERGRELLKDLHKESMNKGKEEDNPLCKAALE